MAQYKNAPQLKDEDKEKKRLQNPILALRAARKVRSNEHVPTKGQREAVEECIGIGLTHGQVAKTIGISLGTLRKYYKDELELGKITKIAALSQTMFEIGTDPTHKGVVPAAMYLLKTQGGEQFRETQRTELTGKDGKPLQVNTKSHTIDPTLLSGDQREALREILTSAMKLATPAQPQIEDNSQTIDGEYDEIEDDNEDYGDDEA
jgi:transcriptional regulator with XRE-family HTH domain